MPQPHLASVNYQAQAILSRRDQSEAELRRKLQRQGFPPGDIDAAVGRLKKLRLIDDAAVARRYADSLLQRKPAGPRYLIAKLRSRGIARPLIDEAVARACPPSRERELSRQAALAWLRTNPRRSRANQVRLARHLAGRGFRHEVIVETLDLDEQNSS